LEYCTVSNQTGLNAGVLAGRLPSNVLYGTECFGTFMGMADLVDLLKDIEQIIIQRGSD